MPATGGGNIGEIMLQLEGVPDTLKAQIQSQLNTQSLDEHFKAFGTIMTAGMQSYIDNAKSKISKYKLVGVLIASVIAGVYNTAGFYFLRNFSIYNYFAIFVVVTFIIIYVLVELIVKSIEALFKSQMETATKTE
jgi:hypothetical protein